MRRLVNGLLVLCLAVSLSTATAHAAPRRDAGDTDFAPLKKIVQIIKRIVKGFDDPIDISWPKP